MVRNAVHKAFLNTLTMGTPFSRFPPRNDPCSEWTYHVGAFSELVDEYERFGGGVSDGGGDLVDVDGERWEIGRDALSGAHASEDLVGETDLGGVCRHVAANVRHEYDQTHL